MAVTFTPTLANVGARLRARTKDSNGNELGTFTTETRPTASEVNTLIEEAVGEVASRIGNEDPCAEDLSQKAVNMAALYAAMQVELSYFPEQVSTGKSPYEQLERLYDKGMKALIEGVAERCGEGGGGDSIGGDKTRPQATFPEESMLPRDAVW